METRFKRAIERANTELKGKKFRSENGEYTVLGVSQSLDSFNSHFNGRTLDWFFIGSKSFNPQTDLSVNVQYHSFKRDSALWCHGTPLQDYDVSTVKGHTPIHRFSRELPYELIA